MLRKSSAIMLCQTLVALNSIWLVWLFGNNLDTEQFGQLTLSFQVATVVGTVTVWSGPAWLLRLYKQSEDEIILQAALFRGILILILLNVTVLVMCSVILINVEVFDLAFYWAPLMAVGAIFWGVHLWIQTYLLLTANANTMYKYNFTFVFCISLASLLVINVLDDQYLAFTRLVSVVLAFLMLALVFASVIYRFVVLNRMHANFDTSQIFYGKNLIFHNLGNILNNYADKFLIAAFVSAEDYGYFSMALQFGFVLTLLGDTANKIIQVNISKFHEVIEKSYWWIIIVLPAFIILGITLLFLVFSDVLLLKLLNFLFGDTFDRSANLITPIIFTVMSVSFAAILGNILLTSGSEARLSKITASFSVLSIITIGIFLSVTDLVLALWAGALVQFCRVFFIATRIRCVCRT